MTSKIKSYAMGKFLYNIVTFHNLKTLRNHLTKTYTIFNQVFEPE